MSQLVLGMAISAIGVFGADSEIGTWKFNPAKSTPSNLKSRTEVIEATPDGWRGLAVYHWVLREFDAAADWFEKAIDQHDPAGVIFLRVWYGRELRATPRWAGLMRKLNLPES